MVFKKFRENIKGVELGYKLLALFLVVFIFPLVLFGVLSYQNMNKTLQKNAIDYNNDKIALVNTNIDSFFKELNTTVNSLQADNNFINRLLMQESDFESTIDYINRDESIYNKISNILIQNKELVSVYVYVDGGDAFYVNFHSSVDTEYSPEDENWYKSLIAGSGEPMLLQKMTDRQSVDKTKVVPYVSVIEAGNEEDIFKPKIVLQLNVSENFAGEFIETPANEVTELYILEANKSILASSSSSTIDNMSGFDFYIDQGVDLNAKYADDRLLVSHIINNSSGLIVVALSNNENIMDASKDYRTILVLFTVAMLILFIIVSVVISIGVSRPIKNLKKLISDVEKGSLEAIQQDSMGGSSWLMSAHFDQYVKTINELLKQINEHINKRHEQEIKILQAQINPHFIYNTLNTIKWLAKYEGNEKTEEGITALIQLLKSTIQFGRNYTSIEEEIQQIGDYIKIQKLRYDDSFSVDIEADRALYKYKTLKFMLQPIVENAIFHGIDHEKKNGHIGIKIEKHNNDIVYTISDNGCGMNEKQVANISGRAKNNTFTGIGIQNVSERIKKYFGEKYGIEISSKKGEGTKITATIPALLYDEDKDNQ